MEGGNIGAVAGMPAIVATTASVSGGLCGARLEPIFRCGRIVEEADVSAICRSLDLRSPKRLSDNNRQSPGAVRGVVQSLFELRHRLLRLNRHVTHVDQGKVLMWRTPKRLVGLGALHPTGRYVGWRKEPRKAHANNASNGIDGDIELEGHAVGISSDRKSIVN